VRIAWLGLVIACATPSPPPRIVAPPPPVPPPPAPPVRGVVARPIPVIDAPRVVEDHPKRISVVAGSLRAELTPDGVALAQDQLGFAVIAAAHVAGGWVFVAADGTVVRADNFLGPLVRLGEVPREPWKPVAMPATCGRVAVGGGDVLYSSDGGPLVASKLPGDVIGAAFADARRGMVVVDGGALYETRDAGATFSRVDLGDDAAATVRCEAGALRVDTLAASLGFAPDGTRAPSPPAPAAPLAADLRFAVERAVLRAYPEVAEQLGGVRARDGSAMFFKGDRLVPLLPDDPDRHRVRHCKAAPWGDGLALVCDRKLYRVDSGGEHLVADDVASPVLSDDGRHAMWDCSPPSPRGAPPTARTRCVYNDGKVSRGPGHFSVAVMHGAQVVDGHWDKLDIVDIDTGAAVRTVAITQPPGTTRFELFRRSGDGSIVFADASALAGTTTVRVVLAGGDASYLALPAGATRSGFADARRGIAAGYDLAKLWRTDDGGAHWLPLAVEVDGELLARPERYGTSWLPAWSLDCTRDRCIVDGRVAVDFDVLPHDAPRVIASRLTIAAPSAPPAAPSFACKLGASRPGPARTDTGDQLERGHLRYDTPSARIDVAIAGTSWAASWEGRDLAGAYRARSAGTLPQLDHATYELRHVSRHGVVVTRNGDAIWLPAGGRPTIASTHSGIDVDVLALPDGRVMLVAEWVSASYRHDGHLDFARATVIDASGHATTRAMFSPFEDGRSRYAAVIDGIAGTASVDEREARSTRFVALTGEPHAVPAIAGLPVCHGAQPATTIVPIFDGRAKGRDRLVVDRVYLHDDACIAGVELHEPYASRRGRHAYAAATDAGELAGEIFGDGTIDAIACTPQ
jgi:hypothetical protein